MKRYSHFVVNCLIFSGSLLVCCNSPILAQLKPAQQYHHTKAEKQQIVLAKQLHEDFIQGHYKAVYAYFGKLITDKMSRSTFDTKAIPVYQDIEKKAATLTVDKEHTSFDIQTIHSVGIGEPQSGRYTSICFVTFYKKTPVRKELCFTWLDNNPKVAGIHLRLGAPKNNTLLVKRCNNRSGFCTER